MSFHKFCSRFSCHKDCQGLSSAPWTPFSGSSLSKSASFCLKQGVSWRSGIAGVSIGPKVSTTILSIQAQTEREVGDSCGAWRSPQGF